ncbi:MAG: type II secretion system F family protein [Nanoarchaeota archaeon]|nr:type II secretion system F family protein [Nanoarchaeota archaeon]
MKHTLSKIKHAARKVHSRLKKKDTNHQEEFHKKVHALEKQIEYPKKKNNHSFTFKKNPKAPRVAHKKLLRKYLDRAGYEQVSELSLTKRVFNAIVILCLTLSVFLLVVASMNKPGVLNPTILIIGIWTGVFAGMLTLCFVLIYLFLNFRIFNRRLALEAVLPDFLQLTAANISAGMPMDHALWFAVRPQFGILSKEIEEVAKSTVAGEDLGDALQKFAGKYDSVMLTRAVNLILEGLSAGGEMAELLNKVAINLQELRLMKREMSANVTTYVIFISFATLAAAPFLFALSTTLAEIIQQVVGGIDMNASSGSTGMALTFNPNSVNIHDFKIFCMLALGITSIFSASIINIIQKGNIKEGFKFIPIFIIVTITLYFVGLGAIGGLFKGFF